MTRLQDASPNTQQYCFLATETDEDDNRDQLSQAALIVVGKAVHDDVRQGGLIVALKLRLNG